jgi:hypothetical protein
VIVENSAVNSDSNDSGGMDERQVFHDKIGEMEIVVVFR